MEFLLEKIHEDPIVSERETPVTIEEFIEFGLELSDYVKYIGLILGLQSELLLYGYPKSESCYSQKANRTITSYPTIEKLLNFCKEKKLINTNQTIYNVLEHANPFEREDAEYYHGWFRFPVALDDFRLIVERKLIFWDAELEYAYIFDKYPGLYFEYEDYSKSASGSSFVEIDSDIRVKRWNATEKKFELLTHAEIKEVFLTAKQDLEEIEKEIEEHEKKMPTEQNAEAVKEGLPWIRKLYTLLKKQEVIESVYEKAERAFNTPDAFRFKATDTLFIFCGENTCRKENHLVSEVKAEFGFYTKPKKIYKIERCAHCKRFQTTLENLGKIFDEYGVLEGIIVYDDESGRISNFAETSIFYDMGYTVSQNAGLTAEGRQRILRKAIETGAATKTQVLNFLRQRISINGTKDGNEIAQRKWQEDYEYIRTL